MVVRIFSLASGLHAEAMSQTARDPFIREVTAALSAADPSAEVVLEGAPDASYGSGRADLIYIRTGGTEGAFKAAFSAPDGSLSLPSAPILLLTSGKSNSLAASMEILSFLRLHGHKGEILHGSAAYIAGQILSPGQAAEEHTCGRSRFDAPAWKPRLAGKRLGLVGRPSDWLISSDVDPETARRDLGLELVDIPMAELVAEIRKASTGRAGPRSPNLSSPVSAVRSRRRPSTVR